MTKAFFEIWFTTASQNPYNESVCLKIEAEGEQDAVETYTGFPAKDSGLRNRGRVIWKTSEGKHYIVNKLSEARLKEIKETDEYIALMRECSLHQF